MTQDLRTSELLLNVDCFVTAASENVWVQPSTVKTQVFFDCLNHEDGTHTLSRNVCDKKNLRSITTKNEDFKFRAA